MNTCPELTMLFLTVVIIFGLAMFAILIQAIAEIRHVKRQIAEIRRQFTDWQLSNILKTK